MKKFLSVCLFLILLIFPACNKEKDSDSLSGTDLATYELVLDVSYQFKNPSSVRVLSGRMFYSDEHMHWSGWLALSAKNSYGARTTGYYFVSYLDGEVFALDLEEYGTSSDLNKAKDSPNFDIDKVNLELGNKWSAFE